MRYLKYRESSAASALELLEKERRQIDQQRHFTPLDSMTSSRLKMRDASKDELHSEVGDLEEKTV